MFNTVSSSKNLAEFVSTLPCGKSVMGSVSYHDPMNFGGLSFQKAEAHVLVNGKLKVSLQSLPSVEQIKWAIGVVDTYVSIVSPTEYYSLFKERKTYNAVINGRKVSGYPSFLKQRADEIRESTWIDQGRNGEPHVSIEIDGVVYNRNLQLALNGEWTAKEAVRRLRNGTTWIRDYTRGPEILLWLLQNPEKHVKELDIHQKLPVESVRFDRFSETWVGSLGI